jgi:hypothetical protein
MYLERRKKVNRRTIVVRALVLVSLIGIVLVPSAEMPVSAQTCDYQVSVLADNPIAYWRLGETSGTTAGNIGTLGSAVDGTYEGGVTLGAGGLVTGDTNPAASFDGSSDYVAIPSHDDINLGEDYTARTVELWFSAADLDGTQVLYEEGGNLNGFNIFLDGDQLTVGGWVDSAGNWVATTVTAGTGYHVVLVFDGEAATMTGYLNGASFGSTAASFDAMPYHDGLIGIGAVDWETRYPGGSNDDLDQSDFFDGVIDEVVLYNRVLSPARIQRHALGCSATGCDYQANVSADGPTAYWRLGEESGTIAFNVSSIGAPLDADYLNGFTLMAGGLVPGDPDLAASFDGTSGVVDIPDHEALNTGGPYPARTVELWFSAADLVDRQILYEEGGESNGLNIYLDGDELYAGVWATDATTGLEAVWVTPATVAANTTYHVAVVYDGSVPSVTGYLNGTSFGSAATTFTAIPYHASLAGIASINDNTLYPDGAVYDFFGDQFAGIIDEVAVFNTALSAERIAAHALGCGTPTCNALTLGYTGEGTTPASSPAASAGCSAGEYIAGQLVTLSGAVADSGWRIGSWYGTSNDASRADTNTLTMPATTHSAGVNYVELVCYPLTLNYTGQGTAPVASPANTTGCPAGEYAEGESITLSGAVPATGWEIGSWSGTSNDASTANTNTLTMPAAARVASVNYIQSCYTLTVGRTGEGVVPTASDSTVCPAGQYVFGESITLSGAAPDPGWRIYSWYGTTDDGSIATSNTVSMPASDHTAGVNYVGTVCYPLTLGHTGQGSDPVATPTNSAGCDAGQYVAGAAIALNGASPAAGWQIGSWYGTNNNSSTASANTVTMPAGAHTAGVNYVGAACYALTLGHTGQGSDPVATPAYSPGCNPGQYVAGAAIALNGVTPAAGYQIGSWYGTINNSSTANANTVSMPASAHSAGVNYVPSAGQYTLTVNVTGQGSVTLDPPGGIYALDTVVELTPTPDAGLSFGGWSGANAGELVDNHDGTWSIIMNSNKAVTAEFVYRIWLPLTLGVRP